MKRRRDEIYGGDSVPARGVPAGFSEGVRAWGEKGKEKANLEAAERAFCIYIYIYIYFVFVFSLLYLVFLLIVYVDFLFVVIDVMLYVCL